MANYPDPSMFRTYREGTLTQLGKGAGDIVSQIVGIAGKQKFRDALSSELQQYGISDGDIQRAFSPDMSDEDMMKVVAAYKVNLDQKAAAEEQAQGRIGSRDIPIRFRKPILGETPDMYRGSLQNWGTTIDQALSKAQGQEVNDLITQGQGSGAVPGTANGPLSSTELQQHAAEYQGPQLQTLQGEIDRRRGQEVGAKQAGAIDINGHRAEATLGAYQAGQYESLQPGVKDVLSSMETDRQKDEAKYRDAKLAMDKAKMNLDYIKMLMSDAQKRDDAKSKLTASLAEELVDLSKSQQELKKLQNPQKKNAWDPEPTVDYELIKAKQAEVLAHENNISEYQLLRGQIGLNSRKLKKPTMDGGAPAPAATPEKTSKRFRIVSVQ